MFAAIENWKNVYRNALLQSECVPHNLEVAVNYGAMDMVNMVKTSNEDDAIFIINDDAAYMQEKLDRK